MLNSRGGGVLVFLKGLHETSIETAHSCTELHEAKEHGRTAY